MAIIYSYPKELNILPADILIGTTTKLVSGKPKNQTRSYAMEDIANFVIGTAPRGTLTASDDVNITLTIGGFPLNSLFSDVSITAGWAGSLADSRIASSAYWNAKQNPLLGSGIVKSSNGTISYLTDNSSNWDLAYNDKINSATVTGTTTKTLTLTQQDGGTITTSWQDSGALSGIGFVKVNGTTVSYDNSTYVPTSRTITINGVTQDLSSNRSWTINSAATWGNITGNINSQTDLQNALNDKQNKINGTGIVYSSNGMISYLTNNSDNWNIAYNSKINTASVTGTITKTLTLTQQDGNTITANWTDQTGNLSLTTYGSSGPATLVDNILNVPNYTSGGGISSVTSGSPQQISISNADPANPVIYANIGPVNSAANTLVTGGYVYDYIDGLELIQGVNVGNTAFINTTKSGIPTDPIITASLSATGTPSATTFLRGDNTWATVAGSSVASDVQNEVKAGVDINKGQAVYVTGADGTNIIVGLASNISEATSSKTLGLINATVATNGFADVVQIGKLAGLNTIGANIGDPVWLGTNGNLIYGLANKPYAPAHLVYIGVVTRVNANNGEIFVTVQNGFELEELHNVDLETNVPINGDVLGYDGTLWVNKTIAEWLGYTPVPTARTITINGTTKDLSADQDWVVTSSGIAWLQSNATDLTVWNLGKGSIAGNTSFGYQAMKSNSDGYNNTVYGYNALLNNTLGNSNTVYGAYALGNATIGNDNVGIGAGSLQAISTGSSNTSIGWGAGSQLTDDSSGNVHIGHSAGPAYPMVESNKLYINNLGGIPLIGGDFVARTVEIDGKLLVNGQASTSYSSDSEVIGVKTLDFNSGNIAFFTLVGSVTITLSNAIAGGVYTIRLTQGGLGSNVVTWDPVVKWGGGTTPVLSTAVGEIDIVTLLYDGTNFYGNLVKNFA